MLEVTVIVGVALERPPKIDEYRKIIVVVPMAADCSDIWRAETEAQLMACQIASHSCVMVVYSKVESEVL